MKPRHTATRTSNRARSTLRQETEAPPRGEMRNEIIDWLRDAYALERGLETALEKQACNEDLGGEVRELAAAHLQATRRHAEEVEAALEQLEANTSLLKTSLGIMTQAGKGMGTILASDERIRDLLDAYSMEHLEIACYTALAAAAEEAGLPFVVQMCRRILPEEQRMADTLLEMLPCEITEYLSEATAASP